MAEEQKFGGFGSLPGDLLTGLTTYFGTTPTMSVTLEPFRLPILTQLAHTEHAAANAEKTPSATDVVFKCISIQQNLLAAQDAGRPDGARAQAMTNIQTALQELQLFWVP
jgi:hypothetical protein